jgi:hypothetical protein
MGKTNINNFTETAVKLTGIKTGHLPNTNQTYSHRIKPAHDGMFLNFMNNIKEHDVLGRQHVLKFYKQFTKHEIL